jgi:uncharacterized protein YjgD (DUF1641 family)
MATPIPLELPPRDPRAELLSRLEIAPVDHAEALLAAYEVLQGLHDKGMIEALRGVIGSSDQTLKMLVDAAKTPEAIRGMRNFVILAKLAAALDPDLLAGLAQAVPESLAKAKEQEPLSLLQLLKKLRSEDSRRALTALTCALESVGKTLGSEKQQEI